MSAATAASTPRPPRPRAPEVPGVSYQHLHRWARQGLLRPLLENPAKPGGRGNRRIWPAEELRVAEDIGRLRASALRPELAAAHAIARAGRDAVEAYLAQRPGVPR